MARINFLFFIENTDKLGYKDCYRFVLFLQWFVQWLYKSSYSPTLLYIKLFMYLILVSVCLAPVFQTVNTCTFNMFLWCHKMVCLNICLFIHVKVNKICKVFTKHAIWLKLKTDMIKRSESVSSYFFRNNWTIVMKMNITSN